MNKIQWTFWIFFICLANKGCLTKGKQQLIETDLVNLNKKTEKIENRVAALEDSVQRWTRLSEKIEKKTQQTSADYGVVFESIKTELKTLSGSLEVIKHDLTELHQNNSKVQEDFDARIGEVEKNIQELKNQYLTSQDTKNDDIAQYNDILHVMTGRKDYNSAIKQFKNFVRRFPNSPLASNAQYWIGEAFYEQKKWSQAIQEYQIVVDKYSGQEKECDALLKQGLAFLQLKDRKNAKLFLTEAKQRCANSTTSKQASRELQKMDSTTQKPNKK